ncbi:MAG: hypothetical protein ACK41O_26850, partial [Runella zeae]
MLIQGLKHLHSIKHDEMESSKKDGVCVCVCVCVCFCRRASTLCLRALFSCLHFSLAGRVPPDGRQSVLAPVDPSNLKPVVGQAICCIGGLPCGGTHDAPESLTQRLFFFFLPLHA